MPKSSQVSRSKANQEGYQRRRAKAQVSSGDVYEHIPEKTRRSNIKPDLNRTEAWEFGVIDEATEEQREALRARLVGESVDNEEIDSEDDEELDSDQAFEESDDERFAGFFSVKRPRSTTKKNRNREIDLNEDDDILDNDPRVNTEENEEEEEEEGQADDDEFINLVDLLDGKGELDPGSDKGACHPTQHPRQDVVNELRQQSPEEDGDESDDEEGETEDEQMDFAPSDEEVPGALDQLHNFVSNLDVSTKKRKASETNDDPAAMEATSKRAHKRRFFQEMTEAGDENEFRVQSSGQKLQLDDLLAPLAGKSSALQSLKKSTKVLASESSKTKSLSAPLPHRQQERLDREAAYEQTKEVIGEWSETMRRIREAEHLSFPLQAPSTRRVSGPELTAKFKPTTQLERDVDALLKAANMREEDIPDTEDALLKAKNLTVEEIAERRNELCKMRELMFRAEIKSRRVKKIKSKTYRRLRRKQKEHVHDMINETAEDDGETQGQLRREVERAKERATLRHKHTGKWAKHIRNREGMDDGTRRDVEDMLAKGDRLRRRIQGVASGESDEENSGGDDDDDSLDGEEGISKVKQDAFDELAELESGDAVLPDGKVGKGVFEMKFMKEGMARKASVANREVDDFIKEMNGEVERGSEEGEANVAEAEDATPSGVVAVRSGGRVVYRPVAPAIMANLPKTISFAPSDTSSVTLKSTDLLSSPSSPEKRFGLSGTTPVLQDRNPWLVRDERLSSKGFKTKNSVVVSKDSKAMDKARHRLNKRAEKQTPTGEKDDDVMEISMDNVLRLPVSAPVGSTSNPLPENPKVSAQDEGEDGSGVDSEVEAQERALLKVKGRSNGLKPFEQRQLVALAFAGDNVVQSFEDAKRSEIAADAPGEVDTTIPGWGSWGGAGIKKAPPKPERIKKVAGIDPTTRADYQKKNVIISEKLDKKAAKYRVKDLPYPYTSKAQFDRAMDAPLGTEWNTRLGFQKGTLPRIVKKPGIIIEPLQKFL